MPSQEKIAIIGGGIVGSTAAYYLQRANYQVTLFDEGTGQATKAAAGIICPWLSKRRNKPWYFLVSQGAEFYRQFVRALRADGYDPGAIFQEDGALLLRKQVSDLEADAKAYQKKKPTAPAMGQIKGISGQDVQDYFPLLETSLPATFVSGGARVDGQALIQLLHQAFQAMGGHLITERAQIKAEGAGYQITSDHSQGLFHRVLLAAGAWLPELVKPLGLTCEIEPQKGQLFSLFDPAWKDQHWPVTMLPGGLDLIPFRNGEIVIGASHEKGMGYDLSIDQDVINSLRQQASSYLPMTTNHPIHRIEVGSRAYTPTSDVLVGPVPLHDNLWAISGLGASGLTSGPYLGYQWSQLIQSGQWSIDPALFPVEPYLYPSASS